MADTTGTLVPSTKLVAGSAVAGIVTGLVAIARRYGWDPAPWVVELATAVVSAVAYYLVPELNPSRSAVQAVRSGSDPATGQS